MQAQQPATTGEAGRLRFLDGLRGWAAVVVLLHHVFVDGLPANGFMADRSLWAKVFFLNGTLAVCVFFVISGFSLSIRYLDRGDGSGLARIAAGRYLRLTLPIFAICAITHALLVFGVIPPPALRPPPLDVFLTFTPTLEQLFGFSLLKVFVAYSGAETYDPPLWTMSYEFYGSFIVFAVVALLRPSRLRTLMLSVLFAALASLQSYFALFIAGILIADIFLQGVRPAIANRAGAALLSAACDLAAKHLVRPGLCRRRDLPDRRRDILRAGTPLLRKRSLRLPRLDFFPALPGTGRRHLCGGAARSPPSSLHSMSPPNCQRWIVGSRCCHWLFYARSPSARSTIWR